MKTIAVLLIFAATAATHKSPNPNFKVDCSTIPAKASPSCRSFKELLNEKDKDILDLLVNASPSYVCFRQEEDSFVMLTVTPPSELLYQKIPSASGRMQQQQGFISYSSYKDGVSDDSRIAQGFWKKGGVLGEIFLTQADADNSASMNNSELSFSYSYKNLHNMKTDYNITIRRSTLRFVETYQSPGSDNSTTQSTHTGHCVEFK